MRAKVKSLFTFDGMFSRYELIATEKPSETIEKRVEISLSGKERGSRINGMCNYSVWSATQTDRLRPTTDTSPRFPDPYWQTHFRDYKYVDTDEPIFGTVKRFRFAYYYRTCSASNYAFLGRSYRRADSIAAHYLIEDGSGAFALGYIIGMKKYIYISTSDPRSPMKRVVDTELSGFSPTQCKTHYATMQAETGAWFQHAQPVNVNWDAESRTLDFQWPDAPTEASVKERCDTIRRQADGLSRFRDGLLGADLVNGFTALPDVDNIENATQLSSLGQSLLEILNPKQLAKGILSHDPKAVAKALSNKHLAYKYGDRLTIKDAREMYHAFRNWSIRKNGTQTRRAQLVEKLTDNLQVTHRIVIKAQRLDDAASRLLLGAADLGILPDLNTVWNLIPLSFVVEWFVNVTDALEATKAITLRNCFMPLSRYDSKRIEYRSETGDSSFVFDSYEGASSPNPSFPYPDFDIKVEAPGERELVTGECLLVQRFVKG